MRFTQMKLSCWRNFPNARLSFGERLLIFGPNGSGKSNLLDALRFLSDLAAPGGGLWNAVERRGARHLRSLQAPPGHDLKIEAELLIDGEPWGYTLAFSIDKLGAPRVRTETVRQGRRKLLRRPEADDRREPLRLTQTHLEQASTNASLGSLVEALRSVRSFRGRTPPDTLRQAILATPKRPRESRLRRVLEVVRTVWPRLERLVIEHDDQGIPRLMGRMDRGRAATWHPAELFSPGQLQLVALLWEATDGAGPLLLEEPEQGLHPEVVGQLLSLLAAAGPRGGRQLLICTHAERTLDDNQIAPSEILLLHPTAEGTLTELAAEDTQVRAVAAEDGVLGPLIAARTGPSRDGQIPLFFEPTE